MRAWLVAVIATCMLTCSQAAVSKPNVIYLGLLTDIHGSNYGTGLPIEALVITAVEELNNQTAILPEHQIQLLVNDSSSIPAIAIKSLLGMLHLTGPTGPLPSGIVGDINSDVTKPSTTFASVFDVPMVSGSSTSVDLSAKNNFPLFARTVPPDSSQSLAIERLVVEIGWNEVTLIYANDDYGQPFAQRLQTAFPSLGVTVAGSILYQPLDLESIAATIPIMKSLEPRVVIFLGYYDSLSIFFTYCVNTSDVFGVYTFVGVDGWIGPDVVSTNVPLYGLDIPDLLPSIDYDGVIGTTPSIPSGPKAAELLQACVDMFPDCEDNVDMYYAYDAVYLYAHAFDFVLRNGLNLTGENVIGAAVNNVTFMGITGEVKLDENGDRLGFYDIAMYNEGNYTTVGQYSELTNNITWFPDQLPLKWWRGSTETPRAGPAPPPPPSVYELSTMAVQATWGTAAALIAINLAVHAMLFVNRKTQVIKGSSHLLCHVIVLGATVAYTAPGVHAFAKDTQLACSLPSVQIGVGFALILGPLFDKTYRIHSIFNNPSLQVKSIQARKLVTRLLTLLGCEAITQILWNTVDRPRPMLIVDQFHDNSLVWVCESGNEPLWWLLLLVPKISVIGYGAYLAYQVRNVDRNFNESKFIAISIYNVLILGGLSVVIAAVLAYQTALVHAVVCFGVFFCAFSVILVVFGSKFFDLYVNKLGAVNASTTKNSGGQSSNPASPGVSSQRRFNFSQSGQPGSALPTPGKSDRRMTAQGSVKYLADTPDGPTTPNRGGRAPRNFSGQYAFAPAGKRASGTYMFNTPSNRRASGPMLPGSLAFDSAASNGGGGASGSGGNNGMRSHAAIAARRASGNVPNLITPASDTRSLSASNNKDKSSPRPSPLIAQSALADSSGTNSISASAPATATSSAADSSHAAPAAKTSSPRLAEAATDRDPGNNSSDNETIVVPTFIPKNDSSNASDV